jgi:hypothetical protein
VEKVIAIFEQDFEAMLRQYRSSIDDKKMFTGLVKDLFPDQAKNINLLLMAYDIGIAEDIAKTAKINNTFAFRYVKQLMDDYGISRVNADWIVSVWCVCYGAATLGKECEISLQTAGTGPAIQENTKFSSGKKYGDLFTYKSSSQDNGLAVVGFSGNQDGTIIFQNKSGNSPVIEISARSFAGAGIEEAILTEGYVYIGEAAFQNCVNLHQVVMPISTREIGSEAFDGCIKLKAFSIPMLLEKIGAYAFRGTGVRTMMIPKSVYWMGIGVFADCKLLEQMVIPENIDRIPKEMFQGCISLKKIGFHENLTAIEDRAFYGCSSLDYLIIPNSVQEIGDEAFVGTNPQIIIQCSFGSYAEKYCRKNKIKYQLV